MAENGALNSVCVSGYFSPLHKGHLELFRKAKALGDELIVIVDNDKQQLLKRGKVFMTEDERAEIVANLGMVDVAIISVDDDRTVCKTLELIEPTIFANGGDRTKKNIPETEVCKKLGIKMVFGVGEKIQSSSQILNNYV